MTATEVHARRENQRRLMGPVVGRVQADFLEPLIINTFETLGRNNQLPPIPEEVLQMASETGDMPELDIEYTGELARAQKADVAMGIESWLATLAAASEVSPNVTDLVNWDAAMRELALLRGVPADAIMSEKEVAEARQIRAQQEELRQKIELQGAAGEAAERIGRGAEAMGMMPNSNAQN